MLQQGFYHQALIKRVNLIENHLPYIIGFTQELDTAKRNSARWIFSLILLADTL